MQMDNNNNNARYQRGFLRADELARTIGSCNLLLDAGSVLIAQGVFIRKDNIFYPNVVIERRGDGAITIGDNNTFYPGTYIISSIGTITIGNSNEFGSGGCTVKANIPNAQITIGDDGRYSDGVSIMGKT